MYYKAESLKAVQRAYQAEYKCKSALLLRSKNTVRSLGQEKTGDLPAKNEERGKKTLKTMIAENHSLSTRKVASVLQYSQTLIVTVLHDDLHLRPYKFYNWLINI
jgi:hypothetical protein